MRIGAAPAVLCLDNGPEFVSRSLAVFLSQSGSGSQFIYPRSPWQHGHAENSVSRLRAECLTVEVFHNLADARMKLASTLAGTTSRESVRRQATALRRSSPLNVCAPVMLRPIFAPTSAHHLHESNAASGTKMGADHSNLRVFKSWGQTTGQLSRSGCLQPFVALRLFRAGRRSP